MDDAMSRYIAKPHQDGYQVYDTMQSEFCIATWTTLEATAQRRAVMLNQRYARSLLTGLAWSLVLYAATILGWCML
jgi:hypothetical protein